MYLKIYPKHLSFSLKCDFPTKSRPCVILHWQYKMNYGVIGREITYLKKILVLGIYWDKERRGYVSYRQVPAPFQFPQTHHFVGGRRLHFICNFLQYLLCQIFINSKEVRGNLITVHIPGGGGLRTHFYIHACYYVMLPFLYLIGWKSGEVGAQGVQPNLLCKRVFSSATRKMADSKREEKRGQL
jgi:hypothetical protein